MPTKPKKKPSAYANKTPSAEERMKQFKNDPNAQNAVDYMTTAKGYQPDPLKSRGGSISGAKPTVKKGTGVPVKKLKIRPKF